MRRCLVNADYQKMYFVCLGLSHRTTPLHVREGVYVSGENLANHLFQIKEQFDFDEVFILSTCNRFECYGVSRKETDIVLRMKQGFALLQRLCGKCDQMTAKAVESFTYHFQDKDCVEHLLSVVASLDSLIIGETQITGQFKDAVRLAASVGTLGPILDRLSQEALSVSKKIRTQTAIGKRTVSISHAAIDLAKRVFGNLSKHRFLLIGAGEMGEIAAHYAISYAPDKLWVINRTLERARLLVERLAFGEAACMQHMDDLLEQCDIVLFSTAAEDVLLSKSHLSEIMARRKNRPLFICDISIPRNVAGDCGELDEVYLFDIDDLKQVVKDHLEERQQCAQEAKKIVKEGLDAFFGWYDRRESQPVLGAFRSYLDQLTSRELARSLDKGLFQNLSEEQKEGLSKLMQSVSKKIASDAARSVLSSSGPAQKHLSTALEKMFCNHESATKDEKKQPASLEGAAVVKKLFG